MCFLRRILNAVQLRVQEVAEPRQVFSSLLLQSEHLGASIRFAVFEPCLQLARLLTKQLLHRLHSHVELGQRVGVCRDLFVCLDFDTLNLHFEGRFDSLLVLFQRLQLLAQPVLHLQCISLQLPNSRAQCLVPPGLGDVDALAPFCDARLDSVLCLNHGSDNFPNRGLPLLRLGCHRCLQRIHLLGHCGVLAIHHAAPLEHHTVIASLKLTPQRGHLSPDVSPQLLCRQPRGVRLSNHDLKLPQHIVFEL